VTKLINVEQILTEFSAVTILNIISKNEQNH